MTQMEVYIDRDTGDEITLQMYDRLIQWCGPDKVKEWVEVITIPEG